MLNPIITDLGVFEAKPGGGLVLREVRDPDLTVDDVRARTAAPFAVDLQSART